MRPLFVVFDEPRIQIGLQFLDRTKQPLAEGVVVELVLDGSMEPLTDAICLRAVRFGLRVIHILDGQIQLIGVVLDLSAILSSATR